MKGGRAQLCVGLQWWYARTRFPRLAAPEAGPKWREQRTNVLQIFLRQKIQVKGGESTPDPS